LNHKGIRIDTPSSRHSSRFAWQDTTAAQAYTIHDFHPVIVDELVRHGAARSGLTWHFARPPVADLEYEMDCRRVLREVVI
jgi:hypothetical protein